MKDQINTIRSELTSLHGIVGDLSEALTALAQLEAMVGQVLTVVECVEQPHDARAPALLMVDGPLLPIGTKLYTAAPVAQQYEAGDMASAAAQGFRDGVASVTQQEPVAEVYRHGRDSHGREWHGIHWYEPNLDVPSGTKLYIAAPAAQQPQGEVVVTWNRDLTRILAVTRQDEEGRVLSVIAEAPDRITPAELAKRIERGEKWEVAQQPQARPDFTDEWTGYLKDGETPFERFLRERKDMQSVLKLYQRVLEENERLKAQQPQAKPDIHEAQGQIEFLDRKNNALSAAIRKVMARLADLLDEDQFKEIEETISSAGVQPQAEPFQPDWVNYRQGLHDGWDEGYKQGIADERTSEANIGIAGFGAKVNPARENPYKNAAPQQAEAVQCSVNSVSSRMCEKGTKGCDAQHAPQQAEAVPNVCASFYTESAELIGTTEAPIKRVEREDDGTLHVYIDYWPQQAEAVSTKFKLGDTVRKTKGSQWHGAVVGTYSTSLTPEGYAVESATEKGSVQIYPASALELWETPQQAEAVPPTHVLVPVAVLKAASESLGNFVSDHGWTDADMQAMDNLDAAIAQQKGQT